MSEQHPTTATRFPFQPPGCAWRRRTLMVLCVVLAVQGVVIAHRRATHAGEVLGKEHYLLMLSYRTHTLCMLLVLGVSMLRRPTAVA